MWQPALLQQPAGLVLDLEWELLVAVWGLASWLSPPGETIIKKFLRKVEVQSMVSVANDLRPSNLDGHNRIQTHDLKSLFLSKVKEEGAKKKNTLI